MLSIKKPTAERLDRFLAERAREGFSYDTVGISEESPAGFTVDEERTVLGQGRAVFAKACGCLQAWQHFALPWVTIYPAAAPVVPGTTVAVVVRYLGFYWLNACRVVRVVSNESDRWGFSYGTLWAHAESGEESFTVQIEPDGLVTYRLRAVARPRALVARLGYPFTRALQARFRADSATAMKRAVRGEGEPGLA
jgi:uncharacterized protein (UPF0548 family)